MATLQLEQLRAQIQSGKLGSLYLFDGPEKWLKDQVVTQIIDKVLPPEARDLNLERFNGESSTAAAVLQAAQSLPFLAEKRVVLVQQTEGFAASQTKILSESLGQVPASTVLIFLFEGKAPLRKDLVAQVSSSGSIVTFWTPFPNQLPGWIVAEAKKRGKTLMFDAARLLAEACGDLQTISNELDKIFLFVGEKPNIDANDVMTHGLPDGTGDYNDLEQAIWKRDVVGALKQAQWLSQMGVRAESIFPVFERVFRRLILAHHYMNEKGWSRADLYSTFGLRGRTRQANLDSGLRAYNEGEAHQSLEKIIQANMDLKTGFLSSEMSLTLLIMNLLGRKNQTRTLVFR